MANEGGRGARTGRWVQIDLLDVLESMRRAAEAESAATRAMDEPRGEPLRPR